MTRLYGEGQWILVRLPNAAVLGDAIETATDPTEIAQLTTALSRLMDAEGRAKGRRQRQKARAEEAAKTAQPVVDLDGEFFIDEHRSSNQEQT